MDDETAHELQEADDEQIGRFCDAFVSDFDETYALVISALEKDNESSIAVIETLAEILRQAETWLPAETCEPFETELIPHVVQVLLAKSDETTIDAESVESIVDFLEIVLERVASRLLYCDACLLPTLVRIVDEHRPFYRNASVHSRSDAAPFVTENRHVSSLYLRVISHWGTIGGFTLLLRCLQASATRSDGEDCQEREVQEHTSHLEEGESEALFSFDAIQCIYRSIYAMRDHLSREFLVQYITPLAQSSRIYVASMTECEFASLSRDKLLEIAHIVELVVAYAAASNVEDGGSKSSAITEAELCVLLLQLDMMIRFLKATSLEKRIYGLVEISDILSKSSTNGEHLQKWIEDNGVMEVLFGEKKHPELIKRATTVLRFIVTHSETRSEWIDAIWACFAGRTVRAVDESGDHLAKTSTAGVQTHEVVRVAIHCVLIEVVGFADHESLRQLFTLMTEYSRPIDVEVIALLTAIGKKSSMLRSPIARHLWLKLPQVPKTIADLAIEEIVVLLNCSMDEDDVDNCDLVDDFVELCIPGIEVVSSFTSVSLRLLEKIGHVVKVRGVPVRMSITNRLVSFISNDIVSFERAFRADPVEENGPLDADAHVHGIRERLLALRACMIIAETSGATYSALETVSSVWDACVYCLPSNDESSSLCFQWIEYCFRTKLGDESNRGRRLLDRDVAERLLLTKFLSLTVDTMSMSALSCFHQLFREVNIIDGGIVAYSCEGVPVEVEDHMEEDGSEVSDLLTGKQLIGLDGLWYFAMKAEDQLVAEEAITLLARYHLDIVPTLEGSDFAYRRKRDFIDRCIRSLLDTNPGKKWSLPSDVSLLNRCLDCLRYFLDANQLGANKTDCTERTATSTDNGTQMSKFALDNLEQKLQLLDTYPSPLKDIIYPSPNVENGTPTMIYNGPRRPSWNFRQHHALLEAIQDENDSESRSPERDNRDLDQRSSVEEGIMRRGELSIEIPASERRLSIDTSVNGILRPTQLTTSPSVQTRPNLLWFHSAHNPASEGLEFVIQDLEDAQALSPSKQMQLPVSQLLVNWPGFFDSLFRLVQSQEEKTCKRAWGLLCQLPINSEILKKIVRLRPATNTDVEWSELLEAGCGFRLLYSLRLIEALLLSLRGSVEGEKQAEDSVKRQWRERFLRLGGLQHLGNSLEIILSQEIIAPADISCIGAIARILAYYGRLHYSLPNYIEASSPYDSRLLHSTIPMVFQRSGVCAKSVFALATKIYQARLLGFDDDREMSSYATEMFCAFIPHSPSLALSELTRVEGDGVARWLRFALIDTQIQSRAKVKDFIVAVIAPLTSQPSGALVVRELFKASLSLMTDSEHDEVPTEIAELVVRLSPQVSGLTDWIIESTILSVLLSRVATLLGPIKNESAAMLPSILRVVGALGSQSERLRDIILAYRSDSSDSEALSMPWIVCLLTRRVLWDTCGRDDENNIARDVETRRAAQEVSVALVFDSMTKRSDLMSHILRSLNQHYAQVQNRLVAMGRPWNFCSQDELQDRMSSDVRFAGLVNPGCVCYMNSLLQQLFMMPAFRNGLLTVDSATTSTEWEAEISELQKLFVALASSQRKALDPTEFALSHRDMDGNPTDLNVQMDADEFFCLLLDRVETSILSAGGMRNDTRVTFLEECFGGVLVNQILTEHGQLSEREEKFFALSLDISQKQHLPESLSLYVQGETLDGDNAYYCEQAKKKVRATKRVCIKKLPHTLVCHLKRFEFDFDTMEKIKIHDYLAFPEEIDMFPYTSEAFSTEKCDSTDSKPIIMYDLVGVVVHSGSSDMGHYYSFIKDRTASRLDKTQSWFEFNDQAVKPFDMSTMGEECFGGEEVTQKWDHGSRAYVPVVQRKKRSAYMLVYERREPDTEKRGIASIDWDATPLSVQELQEAVLRENRELHHVVNVASKEHTEFLRKLVEASIHFRLDEIPESDGDQEECSMSHSLSSDAEDLLEQVDAQAISIACQHVFAVSGLLDHDEESTIGSLLSATEKWLRDEGDEDKKLGVCNWLLSKVTASCPPPKKSGPKLARRSWFFDILIFCDKRLVFVQSCFSMLRKALSFIVVNSPTREKQCVAANFLRNLSELFYERDDVEIEDPATGTQFPIPQGSIIQGVTLLASFLKDCAAIKEVRDVLLKYSGFIDRFLFGLQDSDSPRRSKGFGMAPLTSRVRSCTFSLERQILCVLLASLESSTDALLEDSRLLMNQSVLKNMIVFEFDESLTPLLIHTIRYQFTRVQTEKFVSLLLAVLEEVKSTHLEQLLRVVGALLDAEVTIRDSSSFPSVHQHIFSPASGLLEAAAYYRDHRTLHEYAFLLVEFTVTRGSTTPQLQRFFQDDQDIADQVSWVNDWLGRYLDANGSIRRALSSYDDVLMEEELSDEAPHDEAALEKEVCRIFKKAERTFGFSMELKSETIGEAQIQQRFIVEALEDCDDLLFSSDGENQDDDDDDAGQTKVTTRKRSIDLARFTSDQKQIRTAPKAYPEEVDDETSSSCVVRAHMSSAA